MPVKLLEKGLRKYEVRCDHCKLNFTIWSQNKITLRNELRAMDWIWRDVGVLGIVEIVCVDCQKDGGHQ